MVIKNIKSIPIVYFMQLQIRSSRIMIYRTIKTSTEVVTVVTPGTPSVTTEVIPQIVHTATPPVATTGVKENQSVLEDLKKENARLLELLEDVKKDNEYNLLIYQKGINDGIEIGRLRQSQLPTDFTLDWFNMFFIIGAFFVVDILPIINREVFFGTQGDPLVKSKFYLWFKSNKKKIFNIVPILNSWWFEILVTNIQIIFFFVGNYFALKSGVLFVPYWITVFIVILNTVYFISYLLLYRNLILNTVFWNGYKEEAERLKQAPMLTTDLVFSLKVILDFLKLLRLFFLFNVSLYVFLYCSYEIWLLSPPYPGYFPPDPGTPY